MTVFQKIVLLIILCSAGIVVAATQFKKPAKPEIQFKLTDEFPVPVKPDPAISYTEAKQSINTEKALLKAAFDKKAISYDSVGRAFTNIMVKTIIPYWYGTAWDFNGYSAEPQKGEIACGYFVSTTLLHGGMTLNRYKMAQKSAMDGALMLEKRDSLQIKYCKRDSFVNLFSKKAKDGLYMVGLSNHVGYLYMHKRQLYFIHSSYLDPVAVTIEGASSSAALGQSNVFVVADITHNRSLMRKWLNGETVQ